MSATIAAAKGEEKDGKDVREIKVEANRSGSKKDVKKKEEGWEKKLATAEVKEEPGTTTAAHVTTTSSKRIKVEKRVFGEPK